MARLIEWNNKTYLVSNLLKELSISRTSFYRYLDKGLTEQEAIEKCLKNEKREYTFNGERCSILEIARKYNIDSVTLYKYLKEDYKLEEAVKVILLNKKQKYNFISHDKKEIKYYLYKEKMLTLGQIAKLENLSRSNLARRVREGQSVEDAILEIKRNKLKQNKYNSLSNYPKNNISLYQYCLKKGYNYRFFINKINAGKSFEDTLKLYLEKGPDVRQPWKYEHSGVLIKHLLMKYRLNASYVLELMKKKNCNIYDIIPKAVFSQTNREYNKNEGLYLYDLYNFLMICNSDEKREAFAVFKVTDRQKSVLERNHLKIETIKRDLFYYELKDFMKVCTEEEKKEIVKIYGITKEELDYINNRLYDEFILTDTKKRGPVYRKK